MSLEDQTFKIQERFTAVDTNSCGQASVSTGVAFRDTDKPVVQISTPRAGGTSSLNEVNGCPIDLYVDGEAQYLDIDLTSSNIELLQENDRVKIKVWMVCFSRNRIPIIDLISWSKQNFIHISTRIPMLRWM
jgi:hypothetical protein